jgi:CRISPR/Cas system CSM-associated protein Csm3 (group 7 of RAMP superfamily)
MDKEGKRTTSNPEHRKDKLGNSYELEVPEEEPKCQTSCIISNESSRRGHLSQPYEDSRHQAGNRHPGMQSGQSKGRSGKWSMTNVATAPYNFIPLPDTILPWPLDMVEDGDALKQNDADVEKKYIEQYKKYIQTKGKNNGVIDLDITTLTPCFIGGNNEKFFSPTGEPLIPGSTLRGMTKNIFKVITCGAMRGGEDFTDRHLYFRCLMATGNSKNKKLNKYYEECMMTTDETGKKIKKNSPGFLIRKLGKYYICKAIWKKIDPDQYRYRWEKDSRIDWDIKGKTATCWTGKSFDKKQKKPARCIKDTDWDTMYEVPDSVLDDYRNDKNRNRNKKTINLLDDSKAYVLKDGKARSFTGIQNVDRVVPCFFVANGDVVQSFGHGGSYRIPYKKTVGSNVPAGLQGSTIDFSDAVFGRKELWGSRVFFEDARSTGPVVTLPAHAVKPLLGPNPTSYQLYLKQIKGQFPKHWDEADEIRGYKQYWHQNISTEWKDTVPFDDQRKKITHIITPVGKNVTFHSQIRFENLSDVELGALLNVFMLTKDMDHIAYKLGQGKSLGMGSVKISASLKLLDNSKYITLFTADGWENALVATDGGKYVDIYQKALGSFEKTYEHCVRDLVHMLDWSYTTKPGWNKKVASMSNDVQSGNVDQRYKDRALLPTIDDIIK